MIGISIFMLNFSFILWFVGYIRGYFLNFRFFNKNLFFVIFLFLFDNFVVLLRPVTLTLRVFINVSLGHFLMFMIHLDYFYFLLIVYLLEMFVYLVQSFVFITLSISYVDFLFWTLSLIYKNFLLTIRGLLGLVNIFEFYIKVFIL